MAFINVSCFIDFHLSFESERPISRYKSHCLLNSNKVLSHILRDVAVLFDIPRDVWYSPKTDNAG